MVCCLCVPVSDVSEMLETRGSRAAGVLEDWRREGGREAAAEQRAELTDCRPLRSRDQPLPVLCLPSGRDGGRERERKEESMKSKGSGGQGVR